MQILHEAVQSGHAKWVKALLEAGCPVDAPNDPPLMGNSAIVEACLKGHEECVKVLLEAGLDVRRWNCRHETALNVITGKMHPWENAERGCASNARAREECFKLLVEATAKAGALNIKVGRGAKERCAVLS